MKQADKQVFWGGFAIGLGLLGALDGIVFHQLLQWHHVVDSPNHRYEIITDGFFNILVTVLLVWGAAKLFREAQRHRLEVRWRVFWGSVAMGGGTFNLVEGLINHQLLQIHHVKPGSPHQLLYDLLFLLAGALLFLIGLLGSGTLSGKTIEWNAKRDSDKVRPS